MSPRKKLLTFGATLAIAVAAVTACSDGETPFATSTPAPTGGGEPTARPAGGDAANGESLFTSQGCSACHSTGSNTVIGPGLAGIGDRGDDAYIRDSITDPNAVLVDGFPAVMPETFGSLPESDLEDLVAYLKTLR